MDLRTTRDFFDVSYKIKSADFITTADDPTGQALIDQGVAIEYVVPPADPSRVPEGGGGIVPTNMTIAARMRNETRKINT